MSVARQERKTVRFMHLPNGIWGAVLLALVLLPGRSEATTTEQIVTDRHTGLAISGFDPVAYFVSHAPREGRAEVELWHGGTVWRFRNSGNRDAFVRHPHVYQPRYGGYDPTAVARGASTAGHPEIWLVRNDRLYLFQSQASRRAFQRNADTITRAADRQWPRVMRTLVP